MKKKITAIFLGIVLVLIVGVLGLFAVKMFLKHERRQTADIEQLQIESWSQKSAQENNNIKEFIRLHQTTEDKINYLFQRERLNAYQKLACGIDINLLIVGDSIGALPWTMDLSDWIQDNYRVNCYLKNISLGGNDSYAGIISERMLDDDRKYDLILVCYGQNDDEEFFAHDYEGLIRSIIFDYPECNVISVLESPQRLYTSKMNDIMRIAEYYKISIADTIKAFEESGYAYEKLTDDGIHPNDQGQKIYLETVAEMIAGQVETEYRRKISVFEEAFRKRTIPDLESYYYKQNYIRDAISPETEEFERILVFSENDFKRVSDVSWEIELDSISGKLGICWCESQGENGFVVLYNGESVYSYQDSFRIDYTLYFIERLINSSHYYDGTLVLTFITKENADNFKGLVFTDYRIITEKQ